MKNKILIIATILLLFSNSCDDILDKVPLDKPSDETFLQTEDELIYAINAAYRSLWYSWGGVPWEYVLDNCTDIGWDRNSGDLQVVGYGAHSSVTGMFAQIWDRHYTGIAKCNNIIENIDRASENASQEVMDQVIGQAKFLRAYWYSQLIVFFGDVPLVKETLGLEDNKTPRTPKNEIVDFLLTELDEAAQKLPESWGGGDKGRATKGAALALKSRVALVAGRYDIAVDAAEQVMDLGYSLFPDYQKLFTYEGEGCSEVIFDIQYQYGITHHSMPQRLFSRNAKGHSNKIPGQAMIDSYECIDGLPIDESPLYDPAHPFENRDPRFKYTIAAPGDIWLGFQFETHDDSIMCWNYNVDKLLYNRSVHRNIECRDCHTYITKIPHDPVTRGVNCATQCHIKPPFAQKKFSHEKIVAIYEGSVHGTSPQDPVALKKAQPGCKFCHLNPLYSPISEKSVPYAQTLRRCYNCHLPQGVIQAYNHITHRLRKKTTRAPRQIVQLCAQCHQDAGLMKKLNVSPKVLAAVESYNRSIHGKLVKLGSRKAADCISCHASNALHDIYQSENPKATTSKGNLKQTCQQCHAQTNSWFVRIAVHPAATPEQGPVIKLVSHILKFALFGSIFSLLGLLLLETVGRRREGIKLLLKNGASWGENPARKSGKDKRQPDLPANLIRVNHPLIGYLIGFIFMLLTLVVFGGIVHHLTISRQGPGLLRPLWEKYRERGRSPLVDAARRADELEQHRHFHNVPAEYPRLPEDKRPACFICHSELPHRKNKRIRGLMNLHTQFFVCETCHIRQKPETTVVYKWYNPLDKTPQGPFYGTSYDPATGSLSKGKDLLSKIAPFYNDQTTGDLRPAVLVQDAPLAKDYMKVRDSLSPEQREGIKNKFHKDIKPQGHACKTCHAEESLLNFKRLGFSANRIENLKKLSVIGMLSNYDEFYMPELFSEPGPQEDKK